MSRPVPEGGRKDERVDIPVPRAVLLKLERRAASEGRTRTECARRILMAALEGDA